jgi:hypothetical protein
MRMATQLLGIPRQLVEPHDCNHREQEWTTDHGGRFCIRPTKRSTCFIYIFLRVSLEATKPERIKEAKIFFLFKIE